MKSKQVIRVTRRAEAFPADVFHVQSEGHSMHWWIKRLQMQHLKGKTARQYYVIDTAPPKGKIICHWLIIISTVLRFFLLPMCPWSARLNQTVISGKRSSRLTVIPVIQPTCAAGLWRVNISEHINKASRFWIAALSHTDRHAVSSQRHTQTRLWMRRDGSVPLFLLRSFQTEDELLIEHNFLLDTLKEGADPSRRSLKLPVEWRQITEEDAWLVLSFPDLSVADDWLTIQ